MWLCIALRLCGDGLLGHRGGPVALSMDWRDGEGLVEKRSGVKSIVKSLLIPHPLKPCIAHWCGKC